MVDNNADYDFPPSDIVTLPQGPTTIQRVPSWKQGTTRIGKLHEEIIKHIMGFTNHDVIGRMQRKCIASDKAKRFASTLPTSVTKAPSIYWDQLESKDIFQM